MREQRPWPRTLGEGSGREWVDVCGHRRRGLRFFLVRIEFGVTKLSSCTVNRWDTQQGSKQKICLVRVQVQFVNIVLLVELFSEFENVCCTKKSSTKNRTSTSNGQY